ncbi:MAG TPA: SAM-dependent chlorinase/fluorinase [Anaerolineae bacterium]|nr:SAM-dependent chlorinase/fluorinase [Anaerolineae bacterium]
MTTTIALLTDFGEQDVYVGIMKGVINGIAPHANMIDLTHSVPPGDIHKAAFELYQAVSYFPLGTIFLVVVDPGVGTARRPVALSWPERICVGPDNGIFTYLLATRGEPTSVELRSSAYRLKEVSNTFHGRDIFAPAAVHLACGVELEELGPPAKDLFRIPLPRLELIEGPLVLGQILHSDRFGNLITSIGVLRLEGDDVLLEPWLPHCPPARLPAAGLRLRLPNSVYLSISSTYADVSPGEAVAYIGSLGLLEIAVNQARAVDVLPVTAGQEVVLSYKG